MEFLEKDLEEIIFTTPQSQLQYRGLNVSGVCYRQLNLGDYGIADLVFVDRYKKTITILELKKKQININALLQAANYARAIQLMLYNHNRYNLLEFDIEIILIGRQIEKETSFCYLSSLFDNFRCYTYDYSFNGIRFKYESGYSLVDADISNKLKYHSMARKYSNQALYKAGLLKNYSDDDIVF